MRGAPWSTMRFALFALWCAVACDGPGDLARPALDEGRALGAHLAGELGEELAGVPDDIAIGVSSQVVLTLDDGAVTLAQDALHRAVRAEVAAFAERAQDEHAASYDRVLAYLDARGLAAQDGAASAELRDEIELELASLAAEPDYDVAYATAQVRLLQAALVVLDALVARGGDPALAALLVDARAQLEVRRERAAELL